MGARLVWNGELLQGVLWCSLNRANCLHARPSMCHAFTKFGSV